MVPIPELNGRSAIHTSATISRSVVRNRPDAIAGSALGTARVSNAQTCSDREFRQRNPVPPDRHRRLYDGFFILDYFQYKWQKFNLAYNNNLDITVSVRPSIDS